MDKTAYISNPLQMIKPSANAFGINIGTLLALLVLQFAPGLVLAAALILGLVAKATTAALVLGAIAVVAIFAIALISFPAYTVVLVASSKGEKIGFKSALTSARPLIWRSLGINILTVLAVIGGLILFIIPGLIFMAWFGLSQYALVSEDLGAIASMKRSRELVRGRVWEIWGLSSLATAAGIIPILGGLISFVLSLLLMPAMAVKYLQLAATKPEDRPVVHWANYVVIIVMMFANGVTTQTNTQLLDQFNTTKSTIPTYGN